MRVLHESRPPMEYFAEAQAVDDLADSPPPTLDRLPPELLALIGAKLYSVSSKKSLFQLDRVSAYLRRDLPSAENIRPQYLAERALRLLVHDVPHQPAEADIPFDSAAWPSLAAKLEHTFGTEELCAEHGLPSPMPAMWKYVLVCLLHEQRKQDSLDLVAAVKDADEARVKALIAKGADADYYASESRSWRDDDNKITSPLCELATLLLDKDGPTPASVAILRRLLEAGANVNRPITANGKEVLADGEHVEIMRCAGIGELQPLAVLTRVAVAHGGPAGLEPLALAIQHGADVNCRGEHRGYCWAAIHIAVAALHQPAAELLIRAGADLSVPNVAPGGVHNGKRGNGIRYAPIHLVCRAWAKDASVPVRAALREFLAFLVEQGADVNLEARDLERKHGGDRLRPIQLAMVEGNDELAAELAKLGGCVPDGWTVPERAPSKKDEKACEKGKGKERAASPGKSKGKKGKK